MRFSRYLLPTLKETPADADNPSAKLMIRSGMIRKVGAGLYEWLPLGFKVLKKVENVIREEMNRAGALEVWLPHVPLTTTSYEPPSPADTEPMV